MVLAAGQSRRMGASKQLLAYRGSTFIETVLQSVLDSSVDGLIVVANPAVQEFLSGRLPDEHCSMKVNSDPESPMIRSVQLGIESASADHAVDATDGILILLADQPQVTAGMISTCAESFRLPARPPGILIASYRGRRGHPAIFRMDLLRQVLEWGPDRALNELASDHPSETRELPITTSPMPLDVNTREDYDRLEESQP